MTNSCTIAPKGSKQVRIQGTREDKKRITVVLAATTSGKMLKPMVIFKGKTPCCFSQIPEDLYGIHPSCSTGKNVLFQYTKKVHILLVFDVLQAHEQDSVATTLRQGNVQTAVIPTGCTSKVQPVNVSLNKPFNSILKHK